MEAQLQTLQRQLQPHFLFNTLNTISALMHRDVEAADAMLARLGDLLRHVDRDAWTCRRWRSRRSSTSCASTSTSNRRASAIVSTVTFDIDAGHARLPGAKPFAAAARRKRHPARHRPADRAGARAGAGGARRATMLRAGGAGRRRRRAGGAAVRSRTGRRALEHAVAARAPLRRPAPVRGATSPPAGRPVGGDRDSRRRAWPPRPPRPKPRERSDGGCGVTKIRTMVVDDETMARERIVGLLQQEQDIELIGAVHRRPAGVEAIQQPAARSRVPRRADAGLRRLRRDPAGGRREDAGGGVRHRLRRIRAAGLRGARARLPAQAVRPRPLPADAAARPRATSSAAAPATSASA